MPTVGEVFDAWLQNPTHSRLTALRDAIVCRSDDPRALTDSAALLKDGLFQATRDRLMPAMPGLLLSPRAHQLLALAYEGLGQAELAARERRLSGLGLQLILRSGSGTEQTPWIVVRVSDEYDVCLHLAATPAGQSTVDGRRDQFTFTDREPLWFELHRARTVPAPAGPPS